MSARHKSKRVRNMTQPAAASPSSPHLFTWLTAACATLMFLTWLAENVFMADIRDEMERIRYHRQFMTGESSNALQWMLKYQEELGKPQLSTPTYDVDAVANASRGYLIAMRNVLETAASVDPKSPVLTSHLTTFKAYHERYNKCYQSKDVDGMIVTTSLVMAWVRQIYPEAEEVFNRVVQANSRRDTFWTYVFRSAYLVASALYVVVWIIDYRTRKFTQPRCQA